MDHLKSRQLTKCNTNRVSETESESLGITDDWKQAMDHLKTRQSIKCNTTELVSLRAWESLMTRSGRTQWLT